MTGTVETRKDTSVQSNKGKLVLILPKNHKSEEQATFRSSKQPTPLAPLCQFS